MVLPPGTAYFQKLRFVSGRVTFILCLQLGCDIGGAMARARGDLWWQELGGFGQHSYATPAGVSPEANVYDGLIGFIGDLLDHKYRLAQMRKNERTKIWH